MTRCLVWFRSDLRTHDHIPLTTAARRATRGVVGVFVCSPSQWVEHGWGPSKGEFIRRHLGPLRESLEALNIPLRIVTADRFDDTPGVLDALCTELEIDEVHFGREYEVNERRRDERVTDALEARGVRVQTHTDRVLFDPGEVRTQQGGWYSVFSPFKRACYRLWDEEAPPREEGAIKAQPAMVCESDALPDSFPGLEPSEDEPARADLWAAGEDEANRRLDEFLDARIAGYKDQRDAPAVHGTSVLSPYLAAGSISIRRCTARALELNAGKPDSKQKGISHWISELVWREFYQHVLVGYPRVCKGRAFREDFEHVPWRDDPQGVAAWKAGRTGVPLVDAAMRQLNQTGWMHNRCRMVVAMFLSKNLLVDWRIGEMYFLRRLVDADFGSNNGGWQWSASTGTDAAPYFRIQNPVSQSQRHDPEGEYIRRFVPELAGVEGKAVHEPHTAGLFSDLDYPEPIVDLKATRQRAIDVFREMGETREA